MAYIPPRTSLRAGPFAMLLIYGFTAIHYGDSGSNSYSHFAKYMLAAQLLGTINFGLFRLESPNLSATTFKQKLIWAINQYLNPRQIETSSQPGKLPRFPIQRFADLSNPDAFIISRVLMTWLCYLFWRIVGIFQRFYQNSLRAGDYGPDKEQFFRRIHQVTTREICIRLALPVLFILPEMLVMSAHHNFISAVAVFIGGAQAIPGWNFAVYGSLGEAYTIRRYRGIVWHQFLRRDLIGWASIMSSNIFRIPQTSKYNKFAMLYLVFFISACMHAMIYLPAKIRISGCGISHIFQWYSLSPCAIIAEEIAQKLGKRVLRHHGWRTDSKWCYWFGYLWVWGFFSWSLPKSVFPKDDCVF
ncbi:hypothetical protein sscle_14g099290 [Sclerotinia sclerotiorum 1980 UF-70]|uniref:Wax synthase domain-containing protein n=2 Tax=Sclerotinia sclerotiorum (strain ATCC 18683 / 1980 / Ss-1) TaxID=665079 RepID=A0A1D9QJW1_SCLS1|nr:hypothetical protein sscle_14g099290 [Sclerotinia sclerotiorum 1980 UF-70]